MQLNTDRIQTTHVGSLVRPPELVAYMRKRLEREAIDDAAYERYLSDAVGDVVKRQVETGLSIVNDGEYSKSSWYRYVTERLNGLEYRAVPSERPRPTPSSGLDYERFRDFYAEYHSGQKANAGGGYWAVTGPISYRGQAQIGRDIANLRAALGRAGGSGVKGFLPVAAPASVLYGLRDEYYGNEEKLSDALGAALATEYKAITDAGLIVQIDDAWLAAKYDVMVPPGTMADYRAWAEQKVTALNRALEGIPESTKPVSRVLGQLERAAQQRRCSRRHHRPYSRRQSRRLFAGNGEPAARARMAAVGKSSIPAATRIGAGRDLTHHQRRRASDAGRGAAGAAGETHRPRAGHRLDGLRLRPGCFLSARSPLDHVGETRSARRRRASRDRRTVGQIRGRVRPRAAPSKNIPP